MKSTGMFRRLDALGRFVIPKELRKSLGINVYDYMQIFTDGDTIILKKSEFNCILCGNHEELIDYHDKRVCRRCIDDLKANM